MELRHAVPLAIVGWCLMIPPLNSQMPEGLDIDAPLSRWINAETFDTADPCEDRQTKLADKAQREHDTLRHDRVLRGACIKTDDPRLEKKHRH